MPIENGNFIPRYNGYRCLKCGETFLTVDLGPGITPAFMTCMRTEGCGGQSVSLGYPRGMQLFGIPLVIEFVIPSEEDIKKTTHLGLLHHFARGGLMRRACDTAPEWVKNLA